MSIIFRVFRGRVPEKGIGNFRKSTIAGQHRYSTLVDVGRHCRVRFPFTDKPARRWLEPPCLRISVTSGTREMSFGRVFGRIRPSAALPRQLQHADARLGPVLIVPAARYGLPATWYRRGYLKL